MIVWTCFGDKSEKMLKGRDGSKDLIAILKEVYPDVFYDAEICQRRNIIGSKDKFPQISDLTLIKNPVGLRECVSYLAFMFGEKHKLDEFVRTEGMTSKYPHLSLYIERYTQHI